MWDLKTGQLLRAQTVHRGMVTCLAYATTAKLLFSGSIDGSIGVWTDKGNLLQVTNRWCCSRLSVCQPEHGSCVGCRCRADCRCSASQPVQQQQQC